MKQATTFDFIISLCYSGRYQIPNPRRNPQSRDSVLFVNLIVQGRWIGCAPRCVCDTLQVAIVACLLCRFLIAHGQQSDTPESHTRKAWPDVLSLRPESHRRAVSKRQYARKRDMENEDTHKTAKDCRSRECKQ